MWDDSLDWPRIETAAAPTEQKDDFAFDPTARRAIAAALVRYVDECDAATGCGRGPYAVASPLDHEATQRILRHVARICAAAGLSASNPLQPDSLDLDVAALDRAAAGLADALKATTAARGAPASNGKPFLAFARFVQRLADIYEGAGGKAARSSARDDAGDNDASDDVKVDRTFVKFLRALLLDAEEVLLGLPEEPALRRGDGSFARRIRSALARRNLSEEAA